MGDFLNKIKQRINAARAGRSAVKDGLTMTGTEPNEIIINPDVKLKTESTKKRISSFLEANNILTEMSVKNSEFNLNDAKGKLFEILTGSHIKHGSDKNGNPAGFLTHYRDEKDRTPQTVHDYIKRELQKRHPGVYEQINQHAREAADHVKRQLAKEGHTKINDAAWTSQPSDHKSFTGHEDPNSDADNMIRTNKGNVGISLKYGSQKLPNLRNPGLSSVESLAGTKPGELTNLYNTHQNKLKEFGYNGTSAQNHADYKADKNSERAKAAEQSSLATRKAIAQKWQNGYSKMSSDKLKNTIRSLVSPETKYPHYRLHTRVSPDGNVTHHMAGVQDEVNSLLSHYAEFKAIPHTGEGITAQILGRHHGSDSWHPVIRHGVKGVSGPMRGIAGTTKLLLREPKKSKTPKTISKPSLTNEESTETVPTSGAETVERHHTMFFGRANPPHAGHEAAYNKVLQVAKKFGGTSSMVLSRTHDNKKNPLTPQQKLKHARRAFPDVNVKIADRDHPTLLHQLSKLHEQGVTHLHTVAGSDRIPEFRNLINRYNGVRGQHGYYNFKSLSLHSAGERDPDAEGTAGVSATVQRNHAAAGRKREFMANSPSAMRPKEREELFNDTRSGQVSPKTTAKKLVKRK